MLLNDQHLEGWAVVFNEFQKCVKKSVKQTGGNRLGEKVLLCAPPHSDVAREGIGVRLDGGQQMLGLEVRSHSAEDARLARRRS